MPKWLEKVDNVDITPHNYERTSTSIEQTLYDYNGCYSKDYDIADSANINFKVLSYC